MSKTTDQLNELVTRLRAEAKLDTWSSLVEQIGVPTELVPALVTMRPEMIRLAPPRELDRDECLTLYKLVAALLETNLALQIHAQRVAQLVDNWTDAFKHLQSVGRQIEHFANFHRIGEE